MRAADLGRAVGAGAPRPRLPAALRRVRRSRSRRGRSARSCADAVEPVPPGCGRCGQPGPEALCGAVPRGAARLRRRAGGRPHGRARSPTPSTRSSTGGRPALARPLGAWLAARAPLAAGAVVVSDPARARTAASSAATTRPRSSPTPSPARRAAAAGASAARSCGACARRRRRWAGSREERARNVAGAFEAGGAVAGKDVVLVDDVVTTGATADAAAARAAPGGRPLDRGRRAGAGGVGSRAHAPPPVRRPRPRRRPLAAPLASSAAAAGGPRRRAPRGARRRGSPRTGARPRGLARDRGGRAPRPRRRRSSRAWRRCCAAAADDRGRPPGGPRARPAGARRGGAGAGEPPAERGAPAAPRVRDRVEGRRARSTTRGSAASTSRFPPERAHRPRGADAGQGARGRLARPPRRGRRPGVRPPRRARCGRRARRSPTRSRSWTRRATSGCALWIGASGAAKVFVNGALALADRGYHPARLDQRGAVVSLRKGPNRILVKLCHQAGRFGFFLRLADERGDGRAFPARRPRRAARRRPARAPAPVAGAVARARAARRRRARRDAREGRGAPRPRRRPRRAAVRRRAGARARRTRPAARRSCSRARSRRGSSPRRLEDDHGAAPAARGGGGGGGPRRSRARCSPSPRTSSSRGGPHAARPPARPGDRRGAALGRAARRRGWRRSSERASGRGPRSRPPRSRARSPPCRARCGRRRARRAGSAATRRRRRGSAPCSRSGSTTRRRAARSGSSSSSAATSRAPPPSRRRRCASIPPTCWSGSRSPRSSPRTTGPRRPRPPSPPRSRLSPDDAGRPRAARPGAARRGAHRRGAGATSQRALELRPQSPELKELVRSLEPARERFERPYLLDAPALAAGGAGAAARTRTRSSSASSRSRASSPSGLSATFSQTVVKVLTAAGRRRVPAPAARLVSGPAGGEGRARPRLEAGRHAPWTRTRSRSAARASPGTGSTTTPARGRSRSRRSRRATCSRWPGASRTSPARTCSPTTSATSPSSTRRTRKARIDYVLLVPGLAPAPRERAAGRGADASGRCRAASWSTASPRATSRASCPSRACPGWSEVARHVHVSTYASWDEVARFYWGLVPRSAPPERGGAARPPSGSRARRSRSARRRGTAARSRSRAALAVPAGGWIRGGQRAVVRGDLRLRRLADPLRRPRVRHPRLQAVPGGRRCSRRRFGDCKDKASLMHALLEAVGIDSRLVLLRMRRLGQIARGARVARGLQPRHPLRAGARPLARRHRRVLRLGRPARRGPRRDACSS